MAKKVVRVLPIAMKEIGQFLAQCHCENLGLQRGTPEYEDETKDYIFGFNDEAYGVSMTPSGLIGESNNYVMANPSTPKVAERYYNLTDKVFGKNGMIDKLEMPENDKVKFRRVLRGNIASITHFLLEAKYGMKTKRKNGDFSDFEHRPAETPQQREQTILNQYIQLFYVTEIIKKLDSLLTKEPMAVSDVLDSVFGDKWRANPAKFLNPKETREAFVMKVYEQTPVKEGMGKKVGHSVKKNPINDYYYCHDEDLYFKKGELDDYIQENIGQTTEIRPKESYVKKKMLNPTEVMESDIKTPAIIGSMLDKTGNEKKFLINGEGQILKAIKLGLPVVDVFILTPEETLNFILISSDTKEKVMGMAKNLAEFME